MSEPIAVIGSACRFAGGVDTPADLWRVLQNPRDLRRRIPTSRFNADAFYASNGAYHGHSNVRHAYLLDESRDIAAFDAEFFGVKPVEAAAMDPQQRFLLEVVYEALEHSGIPVSGIRGSDTGVYVGVMFNDYATMLLRDYQEIPTYYATGTGISVLSNRISYFFDCHGPSMTVDTACSSSLVAVHLAVQALRSGESRMAIACGTNLIIGPEAFIIESKLNMLSPDGRSRMWDQGANGYARGEGVAAVVLKTLSAALEDGDQIECIIRETGVNQDGATPGLTMPSATAQESLIRALYRKAGLNILSPEERPQYFEAHGTGTPAGDPIEAEAIFRTFCSQDVERDPLYVGSIKTVLGHTEGTAGVAALIKTSLAMQNGVIPPNLHLEKLSDGVEPFYKNMKIAQISTPWPETKGKAKRASINSFGFGGTNAHAIVETYNSSPERRSDSGVLFTPFVFSASSADSLRRLLTAYVSYLEEVAGTTEQPSLQDLAWTLRQRRSALSHRTCFTASTLGGLSAKIKSKIGDSDFNGVTIKAIHTQTSSTLPGGRILGVFTGQGAQYARMGAELMESSAVARTIIHKLETYLQELPEPDRPSWSLETELLASVDSSRVQQAEISQPLCTALQILLIDLLRLAGVQFSAVIGHSSGEIAAAYAAGWMTARDAMNVAYYRGLHAVSAQSPRGSHVKGAMVAVGSSRADVDELLTDELFAGRLSIAASNSSTSVTVSGDEDAIAELELVLEDEGTFYRRLRVDKAYHSVHMLPCSEKYQESIEKLGIDIRPPQEERCAWFSSLKDGQRINADMATQLADTYWPDNMTKPVLFAEALSSALDADTYDVALEIGPHPALAAPAKQVMRDCLQKELPYYGSQFRGGDAVESLAAMLGSLWCHLGLAGANLDKFERDLVGLGKEFRYSLAKGLPSYTWNHDRRYWHESRQSRKMRLRPNSVHPLLGDITPDSAPHHTSWRNLLKPSELEWLPGHAVQGQTVFPASGYLASALEAAAVVAQTESKPIRMISIHDFVIKQAMPFTQDDTGIEVLIELTGIRHVEKGPRHSIHAEFTYSSAIDSLTDNLVLTACGRIVIQLGDPSPDIFQPQTPPAPHMLDVEPERFYSALADLGYNFEGPFRSLSQLRRKRGKASCTIGLSQAETSVDKLLVHPTELDAVLQTAILAYSYPYDDELRTLHLPTEIREIRFNLAALQQESVSEARVHAEINFDTKQNTSQVYREPGKGIVANISAHPITESERSHAAIQVFGAAFMPLGGSSAEGDRSMYSQVQWVPDKPDGALASQGLWDADIQRETVCLLERIAIFYLRQFDRDVPLDHPARGVSPTKWYLNHARHVLDVIESGKHQWWQPEWANDTMVTINEASAAYRHLPDVEIMHLVGTQMPRVFQGETTMLEEFRIGGTNVLDRYYAEGIGLQSLAQWVARAIKQLVDRHPHMSILEVGAGTGGATKAIFSEIGGSFRSYTYTDVSAGFFETASDTFAAYKSKMIYQVFDIENDPIQQGYVEGSYDLIVAFFVIHAVGDMERSLRNIRKLLKPGGYLIVGEGSESGGGAATSGFIFGTLPGWWVGTDKGRVLSPLVSHQEWDQMLKGTGFSGTDATPPISVEDIFNVFPLVSQAVDPHINFLREPLSPDMSLEKAKVPRINKLVLLGGGTELTEPFLRGLEAIFSDTMLRTYRSITDVDSDFLDSDTAVISLAELDAPIFRDITPERFDALKELFQPRNTMLWITSGRLCDEPYANMTVAFGRVATRETSDIRLQQLDLADITKASPELIASAFLRCHAAFAKRGNQDIFWTIEPEIVLDDAGRQLVPRLRFIDDLNSRYNAGRRSIIQETYLGLASNPVALISGPDNGRILKEVPRYQAELTEHETWSEDTLDLRTVFSSLYAIGSPFGHKHLIAGIEDTSGACLFAFVDSVASRMSVPVTSAIKCEAIDEQLEKVHSSVTAELASMAILDSVQCGQTVLAHNIPPQIARALEAQAASMDVHVIFVVDHGREGHASSTIELPQYLGASDVDDLVRDCSPIAVFVGLTYHEEGLFENEATLIESLKFQCRTILTAESFFASTSIGNDGAQPAVATALAGKVKRALAITLDKLSMRNKAHEVMTSHASPKIALQDLASEKAPRDPMSIVDWRSSTSLPVHKTRLDDGNMFKSNGSTYWIVGMSGALGISAADWMIEKGARYLVMTSRQPNIAPEWIEANKRRGATVKVLPCDVTDEAMLISVHEEICRTLPPIVGVIHGAMVLHDVTIRNMTFDQLAKVTGPKVDGCRYLDKIFWETDLDFFVVTSSINTVIGNLGQANYAAANAFMCSLVAQRRKRGYRAAAVNGGAIIGAGYMEREARRAWDKIATHNYMMRLSEQDFVQSICEAIEASRLDATQGPEISTGLNNVPFEAKNQPFWSADPKFSIFIQHEQSVGAIDGKKSKASGGATLLTELRECETSEMVYDAIKCAFGATLRAMLQTHATDDDLMEQRSRDIGLDSLVSVNVRSWFLKYLQVGVPVLKIMNNDTMENLVRFAMELMPAELTPLLHGSVEDSDISADVHNSLSDDSTSDHSPATDATSVSSVDAKDKDRSTRANEGGIDWNTEIYVPPELKNVSPAEGHRVPSLPPKTVVLTGAGGLLGHHLLDHLLGCSDIQKVVCIALRDLTGRLSRGELSAPSQRTEYHEGDLSAPLLGLDEGEAERIFNSADVVIHNGADTSHMKGYLELRASNVGSTVTLARLCLPRRIPLHYVSSVGLAILHGEDEFPPVRIADGATPATDGSFGYGSAKWVCERILEQVHDLYNGDWSLCIHRPSTIIREGADAVGQKAELDWINALLRHARKSRTVPKINRNRGAIDLVSIQTACAAIIGPVMQPNKRMADKNVGYVHEVGDVVLPLNNLPELGRSESGGQLFEELPMDTWVSAAVADGMHPAVAALVEMMDEPGSAHYPRLLREEPW